jgi:5-(carboxyamino)imidazole ribonucleotide synthase
VTYEFENVPVQALQFLATQVDVQPCPAALSAAQDRISEKRLLQDLVIPTPPFEPVQSLAQLYAAAMSVGLPAVLKTRREGYDGRGQAVLRSVDDLSPAWQALGTDRGILEAFVPFDREISIVAVRGRDGAIRYYPVVENVHRHGILRHSTCMPGDAMQAPAEDYVRRLLDQLDYVGVLTLELFQLGERLLANEFAPRVHNSGHWTIEGAETSQFENHLRAVAGWPLGATKSKGPVAMANFIGAMPSAADVLRLPGVHLHDYDKRPSAGRKLGHATVCADNAESLEQAKWRLLALATSDPPIPPGA